MLALGARVATPGQLVLDGQEARAARGGAALVHAEVNAVGLDEAPLVGAVDDARRLAAEQRQDEQREPASLHARRVTFALRAVYARAVRRADPHVSSIEDALERGDVEAFDRAAESMGGGRAVLRALLAEVPESERARVERLLPPRGVGPFLPRVDVGALAARGPVALWVATEWILRVVPGLERSAPSPAHERWDALLEIHRARIEAPWLPIELLASLAENQRALGRRIALGLDRRFGPRAKRVAAARLRIGGVALADLMERAAGP